LGEKVLVTIMKGFTARMQRDDDPNRTSSGWTTKDSGVRSEYSTGMVRDTQEGKARFDLLFPKGVPFGAQMLTRFAELMERGAKKYDERNWEKARTQDELDRYHSSALRHLVQWINGEIDEDHAAAVMFNILAGETTRFKMGTEAIAKMDRLKKQCDATFNGKQCILPPLHRDEQHLYAATGALHG
jgi:hypothetical protein